MGLWQLIVISIGLSLDVFAYCLYRGATVSEIRKTRCAAMVGLFTGFQMGMMLLGSAITMIPAIRRGYTSVQFLWSFLAACTFFVLGITMITKSVKKSRRHLEEKKQGEFHVRVVLFWAFLTSIDALIAGVGFGFMGLKLLLSALIVGVITAASALVGVFCGFWLGYGPMNQLVAVGGCLVLIGGVDLLINYLSAVF